jgi:group II intron reverse transcriptase/maturase
METLEEAYRIAKGNGGAPGIDGQRFQDVESVGRVAFLRAVREDLVTGRYKPMPNRRVEIPKGNGKVRTLQIPCIRDRVVQGALKLILEAVFEADFCSNSYGFRPKRSPHRALAEVRRSVMRRMSTVIDVDLSRYFDTIRQSVLLDKIAKRIQDPKVMHLVKQIILAGGKLGVPQGGPFSPLAANIYLNEVDWFFDAIRRKTAEGPYEAVNYHRFADDIVITVSGHHTKRGWAERALQRLREQIAPLGVELNLEKTKLVNTLRGEAFGFLGFDLRRVRKQGGDGHFILMTPKKKARKTVKAKVRDIIARGGATPAAELVKRINATLAGWVNYFRVGNASRAFSEVRDYVEMKVRTLLTRRKRRRKSSVGWRRWSNEYLYGVLGLYWDWKIQPLPSVEEVK